MKTPVFPRIPTLCVVEDSSAGFASGQSGPKSNGIERVRRYYPLLLPVAAVMVYLLVRAEDSQNWLEAQVSLVTTLTLLALTLWCWWQQNNEAPELSRGAAIYHRALDKLLWCVAIGILAMLTIATRTEHWVEGIVARAIGYGILIAGAAFISGVLLGYLFGLRPTDNSQNSAGQSPAARPQTNLAEIADWLTKIILGAGLVQLTSMPGPIWKFANVIALGVVEDSSVETPNPAIALAIMAFFSTCGLLYGYLWTRYEDAVTSYGAGDISAAALVNLWLNAHPAPDDQTRANMMNAVKNASSTARMRIFLQAEEYREASTEDVNERSLPVFEALVEADAEGVFHRNRSQSALALMGKKKDPKTSGDEWSKAYSLLNDAIRIRNRSGEPAWREYEFARAVCQIKLDSNFTNDPQRPSDASTARSIRADLDQSKDVPPATKALIDKDQVVAKWEGLNK